MGAERKLRILSISDYNFIANKDPHGNYDRKTRENLYRVIDRLRSNADRWCHLEERVYRKFQFAKFGALEEKDKQVRMEVARYRLNAGAKQVIKVATTALISIWFFGWAVYQFVLDIETRHRVDVAIYTGMNRVGLVAADQLDEIRRDLTLAAVELERARRDNAELSQTVEGMVLNNKVTENLKYILRHIYDDPRTRYRKMKNQTALRFEGRDIVRYRTDPTLWYLLGVIESGTIRVFYDDEEILEIKAIFGRTGEETPPGEYRIINKAHQPTWYKKEEVDGRVRVRAIPFGHPDHEIGTWWLGMKKAGASLPGSYGIHGVNVNEANEFYKKQFDWRSGSAGCPNIQEWYLHFLAKMVPVGTRVTIAPKDKTDSKSRIDPPSSA